MFTRLFSAVVAVLLFDSLLGLGQTISFLPHRNINCMPPGCSVLGSGDFNGDGKVDLIVSAGGLQLWLGDGTGGFKPAGAVATPYGVGLLVADVNRDGKLDLVVGSGGPLGGSPGPAQTYVLLGRGDGTFQATQAVASGYPLFAADVNGDGKPDLVTWLSPTCAGQVQVGNGDGTFQKPVGCVPEPDGSMSNNVAVGDFNGDGIPDFAWSSARSNGFVGTLLGNGDGTFRLGGLTGGRFAGALKSLAVGDLNRDGKLDLVVGRGAIITVLLGNGDGSFQPPLEIASALLLGGRLDESHLIFVADLNGDGKLDIARDNVVIPGNGDGTFGPVQYLLTASAAANLSVVADVNGDGLPDLVYVNFDADLVTTGLSVLLNDTPGPPTSVLGYSAVTGVGLVAPASIASAYGKNLARAPAAATGPTLPTELGGISLRVRDATDTVRLAPLYYVSPTQINFLIPDQTALGAAVLTVDDGSSGLVETANATAVIQVAPGIFTANGQVRGVAAATAVRVLADGSQQPVAVFNCTAAGQCTAVPIDLSDGRPVYLSLYGTGFRLEPPLKPGGSLLECTVGGLRAVVLFVGAQPMFPGLDQINIQLPTSLPSGTAPVQCDFGLQIAFGFDGDLMSNPVQIEIK